jgi:hypothetical protein
MQTLEPTMGKEKPETVRARQQRLREQRKTEGWRRVSIWLDPTEANTLADLWDEWLGRTVKALLFDAITVKGQPQGAASTLPAPELVKENTQGALFPLSDNGEGSPDYEIVLAEAARLFDSGKGGAEVARELNARGWRSKTGAVLRGANLKRDVRLRQQRGAGE